MKRSLGLLVAAGLVVAAAIGQAEASEPIEKVFAVAAADSSVKIEHAEWNRLLTAYVKTDPEGLNRVAYARFKAEAHDDLRRYIKSLEAVNVATLDRREQFAFWANLYNSKTIDIVLQKYPVASIKDINLGGSLAATVRGGPWAAKVVKVGGRDLSLDDIEHGILRKIFKDPRVHYAVNCASIGCPNLLKEAFTGERLEQQLDAAARAFVNSPRGVRPSNGHVHVSSIYSWFQVDFGGSTQGVIAHLKQYAQPALKEALSKSGGNLEYGYDWRLNDTK